MLGKKWLALRLSAGLVFAGGCAHGRHASSDNDAHVVTGLIVTIALSVGVGYLVYKATDDPDPESTMMPPLPQGPVLDEH